MIPAPVEAPRPAHMGQGRRKRPPPDPRNRKPRHGANRDRAISKKQQEARPLYHSPETAAIAFGAAAHTIAVYDGQRLTGILIDADVMHGKQRRLGRAHAFDAECRPLGEFRNRKLAVAAITARDHFETQTRASVGNIEVAPRDKLRADARSVERAWKAGLSRSKRSRLPAAMKDPFEPLRPLSKQKASKVELRKLAEAAVAG